MSDKVSIPAYLEERVSKSGKPYKVIIIKLTDTVDKFVFLNAAELALLELNS